MKLSRAAAGEPAAPVELRFADGSCAGVGEAVPDVGEVPGSSSMLASPTWHGAPLRMRDSSSSGPMSLFPFHTVALRYITVPLGANK
eukprot:CAMPEP_0114323752 /NCGR_PEP_ID=MMETSP0059-20121206/28081_1 /TAXON_ID=36894 /ORGANISM="Pyramimonas parkeae, Strain CCMP726" /LENGTH=86 /DNA_ID=CAMNT_0001452125 /DNA_START=274 /DNA_END=534 /DNA_ORIENTATION=+